VNLFSCKSCSKYRAQEIVPPTISHWCQVQADNGYNLGFPCIGKGCCFFEYFPGASDKEDDDYEPEN
jgi:hypothetical protein